MKAVLGHEPSQRGATAVFVAAAFVLLFGAAAIAIDIGAGFTERRQAQTAADFGSLSALQFAQSCNPCSIPAAVDAGAAEAIAVANANLPNQVLDWAACTDPNRPPNFTLVASSTQCVSFTSNLSQSRVVVPTASVDTTFGAILGANTVDVSATAEAALVEDAVSNILPFAAGSGTSMCLFSNQAPQSVAPCDGPTQGNFGYLDIWLYGSDALNTPDNCNVYNPLDRLAINIALGTDHLLSIQGSTVVNDHSACPNKNEEPNQLVSQPGSPTQAITDGLLTGTVTPPAPTGRLICSGGGCENVRGLSVDNTPLWTYIEDASSAIPGDQCPADLSIDVDDNSTMEDCLNAWMALLPPPESRPIMFEEAIASSPRFAAVPEFASYPSTGLSIDDIVDFAPVFLQTLYLDCNALTCQTIHTPGEPGPGPASCSTPPTDLQCGLSGVAGPSMRIEGLTAFSIDLYMLPAATRELIPGGATVREFLLIK